MGRIGIPELIIVVCVIVLFFGAKKLPEIGRSLGKTIREFKQAGKEKTTDVRNSADDSSDAPKS